MGPWRGAIIVLLLAPALAPPAASAPTYNFEVTDTAGQTRGNQAAGTPGEYRLGETVRLRVIIQLDGTEQVTYTHRFTLFKGSTIWGQVGTGVTKTTGWYGTEIVIADFPTTALSPSDAGHWHATFSTNRGDLFAFFDVDHAPDLVVTHVSVSHPGFVIPWWFARDGTKKTVVGCVHNQGPESLGSATVGLYFKTHAEFLLNNAGRVVATTTVDLSPGGVSCSSHGLPYPGKYVMFPEWNVMQHAISGTPAMYRVGLQADPHSAIWEVRETNNSKDVESTIQPFIFLP